MKEINPYTGKICEVVMVQCNCPCHSEGGVMHTFRCCENGFIKVYQSIKEDSMKQLTQSQAAELAQIQADEVSKAEQTTGFDELSDSDKNDLISGAQELGTQIFLTKYPELV